MGARLPFCGIQKGIDPLESCDGCKEYHCKSKRTNADRIRNMSDEELADVIFYSPFSTKQDALDWLKSPASARVNPSL